MTLDTINDVMAAAAARTQPDFAAIKAKQQMTWASGDFSVIGVTLQIVGESLAEVVDVCAGERVIDVAAGNGNATLAAARRFEWRDAILEAAAAHDVVIFDRYIASNMAYQGAKLPEGEALAIMEWILALETGQFGLPSPTLSVYLDTPWELARELILQKAQRSYTDKSYDEYEADIALQQRVRGNYETIVSAGLLGPWQVIHASADGTMRPREAIVADMLRHLALEAD